MAENLVSERRGHSKVAQRLPELQEQEPAVVVAAEDSKEDQLVARCYSSCSCRL
jgi:3,4-dihydroxy-2-butanone 4-phosphate synthase